MSSERLIGEHDRIEAFATRIESAVASPGSDPCDVTALLGDLAIAIADHRENEQHSVYRQLLNGRDTAASRLVSSFTSEFETFEQDLQVYLADWTAE